MKILFVIAFVFSCFVVSAQHVITIKKDSVEVVEGAYVTVNFDKTKDYILFSKDGSVSILQKTKFRTKKALGYMLACKEFDNCSNVTSDQYLLKKSDIEFSNVKKDYILLWEGHFNADKLILLVKMTETNKLQKVKEFRKI